MARICFFVPFAKAHPRSKTRVAPSQRRADRIPPLRPSGPRRMPCASMTSIPFPEQQSPPFRFRGKRRGRGHGLSACLTDSLFRQREPRRSARTRLPIHPTRCGSGGDLPPEIPLPRANHIQSLSRKPERARPWASRLPDRQPLAGAHIPRRKIPVLLRKASPRPFSLTLFSPPSSKKGGKTSLPSRVTALPAGSPAPAWACIPPTENPRQASISRSGASIAA